MKECSLYLTVFLVLFFVTCSNSFATLISYEFSGSLRSMIETDPATGDSKFVPQSDLFSDLILADNAFSGQFTYETNSLGSSITDVRAIYRSALKGLEVNINNDFTFSTYGIGTGVVNIHNNDQSVVLSDSFSILDSYYSGENRYTTHIFLFDRSASFTNDILIPDSLDLSSFDNTNSFNTSFVNTVSGDRLSLFGTLETLTPLTPTPEPTTILLFGIGLLGVAGISRKETTEGKQ